MCNKLFFNFLFGIYSVTASSQTCIIALRLNDGVVIATDSRRTTFRNAINSNGDVEFAFTYDTICKIQHVGKVYFSQAGMDAEDAYVTAIRSASEFKTLMEISTEYVKQRKPELINYLLQAQTNNLLYKNNFERLKYYGTLFYGIENGIPRIISINVYLVNNVNQQVDLQDSIHVYEPNKSGRLDVLTLGEHDVVDSLIKLGIIEKEGVYQGLITLLLSQADASPKTVSQPFEILTLNINGEIGWNLNPLKCQ